MIKDGDAARKKAADCMTLAAKASSDERRDIFRAMARSWVTLANQMDQFERLISGSESINAKKQAAQRTSHEDHGEYP